MGEEGERSLFRLAKKIPINVNCWQLIPYVHIRGVCPFGSKFEKLKNSIANLLPSEHYRTITAVKLQKPLPIIDRLSEKTKHKIDIEQPIYGVIDGAHRLHVIQELCFSGEDPTNFPEAGLQISVMVPCDEGKVWDMLSLVSAAHSSSLASAAFRPQTWFDRVSGTIRVFEVQNSSDPDWRKKFKNQDSIARFLFNIAQERDHFDNLSIVDSIWSCSNSVQSELLTYKKLITFADRLLLPQKKSLLNARSQLNTENIHPDIGLSIKPKFAWMEQSVFTKTGFEILLYKFKDEGTP